MLRVGLTGNIASGKSSVVEIWRRLGAAVIDADVLAREAVAPGTEGLRLVRERFGDDVVGPDGLDRAEMRRIAFEDPRARRDLEAIIHPVVQRLRAEREAALAAAGTRIVVHDIPLLFEVGMQGDFDAVVLVDAPADLRRERIVAARGVTPGEAERMIASQVPSARKRAAADFIIDNDGSRALLETRAEEVWQALERRAASA